MSSAGGGSLVTRLKNLFGHKSKVRASGTPPAKHYAVAATCQVRDLGRLYDKFFSSKTDGFFVDIGAFDGEYCSNTGCLSDAGWARLCAEPVPAYYELCKARHARNPRVKVVRCAISDQSGIARLNVGGPLSTIDPRMVEVFNSKSWGRGLHQGGTTEARQLTADEFLSENGAQPGFEVLSVDVEGFEWNVLQGLDIVRWKPKMVIVELHDQDDDFAVIRNKCFQTVKYFEANGYVVVYKDHINTVYLLRNLAYPPLPQDGFPSPGAQS